MNYITSALQLKGVEERSQGKQSNRQALHVHMPKPRKIEWKIEREVGKFASEAA